MNKENLINESTDTELKRNHAIFLLEMTDRVIKICKRGHDPQGNKISQIKVSNNLYRMLRSNIIKLKRNEPAIYYSVKIKKKTSLLDNEIEFD